MNNTGSLSNQTFTMDDELNQAFQTPRQAHEFGEDLSFDGSFNKGGSSSQTLNEQSFLNSKQKKHARDYSIMSMNTLQNIQQFEDLYFNELKAKLEEEMIKNETLERKLRTIEFETMIKTNEFTRKIQELELKNSNLKKEIAENEQIYFKHDTMGNEFSNLNSLIRKENPEIQQIMSELENKLTQYENEILQMKEREADLLGQINQQRQENFDLRLKTERYTFFAQRENSPNVRKTITQQKQIPSARTTSGPMMNFSMMNQSLLPSAVNPRPSQFPFGSFQQQPMQAQRFSQNAYSRVSVLSFNNQNQINVKINNDNVQLDQVQDIGEAISMILMITQEKDQLEQELQTIKEKAINQIISKEQQIIDLIKFHEVQVDELKKESSRLQLELQNIQKQDRLKDNSDNQVVIKLQRDKEQLIAEAQYNEDKYEKLHQKYLEERRQQEVEIAYMQDKYQKDIQFYAQKVDKQKEKNKILVDEMERIRSKLMQQQDFKQEIIKDLEDQEQRLRDAENEKYQLEKDFLYKIDIKNHIIQEKTTRIQDLQDQLFNYEDELKKVQTEDQLKYQRQINELMDEAKAQHAQYEDLEIELENANKQISKLNDQITDLLSKKSMLNEIIKEMQQQKQVVEDNHQDKVLALESQLAQQSVMFQQQLTSLKTHILMLEGNSSSFAGANNLKFEMQEVEECLEEDDGTSTSELQMTLNSSRNKDPNYNPVTLTINMKQMPNNINE